jgi:hypothetical protein
MMTLAQADDRVEHLKVGGAELKFHKSEFQPFDGKEDSLLQLTCAEEFIKGQGTADMARLGSPLYHQIEKAIRWYWVGKLNSAPQVICEN